MKGLMLKEYYVIKRYGKIYALYILIFGGAAVFTSNIGLFGAMAVIFLSTIPLSSFSVDESCKWDRMAVSAPLSRKQIVASKYLLLFICIVMSALISLVITVLGAFLRSDVAKFGEDMVTVLVTIGVMAIMMMVLLPFIVKMGAEKGRVAMMLIFGGTFIVILLFSMLGEKMGIMENAPDSLKMSISFIALVILPLTALIAAFISYRISCAIYAKKEL